MRKFSDHLLDLLATTLGTTAGCAVGLVATSLTACGWDSPNLFTPPEDTAVSTREITLGDMIQVDPDASKRIGNQIRKLYQPIRALPPSLYPTDNSGVSVQEMLDYGAKIYQVPMDGPRGEVEGYRCVRLRTGSSDGQHYGWSLVFSTYQDLPTVDTRMGPFAFAAGSGVDEPDPTMFAGDTFYVLMSPACDPATAVRDPSWGCEFRVDEMAGMRPCYPRYYYNYDPVVFPPE